MVGVVIVAHSRELAYSVKTLVEHFAQGRASVAAAGGVEDGSFGTSVPAVQEAIDAVYGDDGVVVLMDIGSSLLSAEMALDFLDARKRERVRLCEAPLVEGAVSAAVCAAGGGGLEQVVREAKGALSAKALHLTGVSPDGSARPMPEGAPSPTREITLKVENPLGIHARPAARLVVTASRFLSEMTMRNLAKGSDAVNLKSVNLVATLDVAKGDSISVAARGPDAEEALDAVRALVESNFGEPLPENSGEERAVRRAVSASAESGFTLRGIPCSPGIVSGPAVVRAPRFSSDAPPGEVSAAGKPTPVDPGAEWRRLEEALSRVRGEMAALGDRVSRAVDAYTGSMYDAFALTLDDPALRERASGMVFGERLRAEAAWARAAGWIAEKYEGAGSELLRLRSADLADVRDRVLGELAGRERTPLAPAPDVTEPSILVARDLSAADVALLDTDRVIGVCTAEGGAQSHAAILARGAGLPMVAGLGPRLLRAGTGTVIAMDGSTGEVTWVSEAKGKKSAGGAAARAGGSGFEGSRGMVPAVSDATRLAPALTLDGRKIEVCANASSLAEVRAAVRRGADGVGVLRTEFLFAGRRSPPPEEEQLRLYESMADALGGRPLTVRTLDAGGDKPIRFLSMEKEDNPFLGVRGIRLSLRNPDVFLEQLRAILRASARGPVKILLPMVSRVEEVVRAKELLDRAKSALAGRGQPFDGEIELGIMIEVPSAAVTADRLAREVSFFSVGTNDLVQYTLAADRANPNVSALGDALHPAVLRLIERCANAGRGAGIRVSVCGEMARDRAAVPILVGLGVDGLSVSPVDIPEVKTIVGRISANGAEALAARALDAESAETARAEAGRFLDAGPAGER